MGDFRVATKSFIVDDGKLLLVKRTPKNVQAPGIWEFPGGRLEPGEDPFKGAKREVMEEVGIDIDILHPIYVRHFKRADDQTVTLITFLCKALTNNVKLSDEHTDFVWTPISEAKEYLKDFFFEEIDVFNKLELHKHV